MNTLLVIDMQQIFLSHRNRFIVEPIKDKIEEFKSNNYPIVFVEFYGLLFRTIRELTNVTKKYNNVYTISKNKPSGAVEIKKLIEKNNLPNKLYICGLYGDDCVFNTCFDLRVAGYDVIGFNDCIGYFDESKKDSLKSFYNGE